MKRQKISIKEKHQVNILKILMKFYINLKKLNEYNDVIIHQWFTEPLISIQFQRN